MGIYVGGFSASMKKHCVLAAVVMRVAVWRQAAEDAGRASL